VVDCLGERTFIRGGGKTVTIGGYDILDGYNHSKHRVGDRVSCGQRPGRVLGDFARAKGGRKSLHGKQNGPT